MYGEAFRHTVLRILPDRGAQSRRRSAAARRVLSSLGEADRRDVYLEVARLAVLEARLKLARNAAENAALLSQPGTLEMYQATLYRSAARAVSDDPGNALAELAALPKDELPQPDRELLDAVRAVVAEIRQLPAVPPAGEAPDAQSEEGSSGSPSLDELASRAETAMAAASETLQEIDR